MQMKKIASMEIWNNALYIGPVLGFLDGMAARHSDMEFGRYNALRYVAAGVLEQRIANSYPGGQGTLHVELYLSDTYFEFSIRDKGQPSWADFSYSEDDIATDHVDARNFILDRMVDGVGIERLGKEGQRIYIRQRIRHQVRFKRPEPYQPAEVLDTSITIRPVVTREDAVEAIRCIYSEYGYSYSYEKLYYVDSLLSMIQNGELMSFLAVNEHGQTAGHFALSFTDTFKNMPEITTVVTRREFRGLGLFTMFMEHCLALGEKHGFRALMGQPVGFHPMSQKAFLKAGFTATAVLLSYIGSDVESEYNKDNQRLDLFASVRILDKNARATVYPPAALRPLVEQLFDRLGWAYELRQGGTPGESTEISVENNPSLKVTKVLLRSSSDGLGQILRDTVRDTIRVKNEMIELLISMNDPSCGYGYETARECGFVLSGLLPGGGSGDYLLMQMLTGAACTYDQLVAVGEFEELTKAVIALNQSRKDR